jgi:hypothetical protein
MKLRWRLHLISLMEAHRKAVDELEMPGAHYIAVRYLRFWAGQTVGVTGNQINVHGCANLGSL